MIEIFLENNTCRAGQWTILRPLIAGWSSPVARQAHNLKVTGSNPVPATFARCGVQRLQRVLFLHPKLQLTWF